MGTGDGAQRRRCCECRAWYRPHPSTAKMQKTCSAECRSRRHARQAKARRGAAPGEFRAAERECQRRRRAQRESATGAGAGPPLSRAGLGAEVAARIEEIINKLGHADRLSRAGLRRRIRRLFAEATAFQQSAVGT